MSIAGPQGFVKAKHPPIWSNLGKHRDGITYFAFQVVTPGASGVAVLVSSQKSLDRITSQKNMNACSVFTYLHG